MVVSEWKVTANGSYTLLPRGRYKYRQLVCIPDYYMAEPLILYEYVQRIHKGCSRNYPGGATGTLLSCGGGFVGNVSEGWGGGG